MTLMTRKALNKPKNIYQAWHRIVLEKKGLAFQTVFNLQNLEYTKYPANIFAPIAAIVIKISNWSIKETNKRK